MIQQTTRPLTDTERAQLESLLRGPPPHRLRGVGRGVFIAVVVTLVTMIVLPEQYLAWPAHLVVGIVAGVVAFIKLRFWPREPAWARLYRADLDAGLARVSIVRAREAVAVEEVEDEGSQYLLGLPDGRGIFLFGQDLYDCEEEGRFPCREFEVVFAPRSGQRLSLTRRGEYLAPRHRAAFRPEEFDEEEFPQDGAVLSPRRYKRLSKGAI